MALRGRQLFLKYQCIACHSGDSKAHAPLLEDLYGKQVSLDDGRTVEANDDYIRESIREPKAKIVSGYKPIMPAFGPDQMDDLELQQASSPSSRTSAATRRRNPTTDMPPPEAEPEQKTQETGVKSP